MARLTPLYIYFYLSIDRHQRNQKNELCGPRNGKHLADRRVFELCFFTFGYIFVGFGAFVSYIPSFLASTFGSGPLLIEFTTAARALSGALTASFLNQLTLKFSAGFGGIIVLRSRLRNYLDPFAFACSLASYSLLFVMALASALPAPCCRFIFSNWRQAIFGPLFALANGRSPSFRTDNFRRVCLSLSRTNFGTMYLAAGTIAFLMMILAFYGNSLSAENTNGVIFAHPDSLLPIRQSICCFMASIDIRGAREHNLKNVDVEIPRDTLTVITGLSGSGKSSLAFDTIYAEGQRRYVESLSAYARQFLELMQVSDVDSIEGLSPAISIEQKDYITKPPLDGWHSHGN